MSVLTPGRNLVLIGMMGAGKTTVGRTLAEWLDRPFVDTDALVEDESGLSVSEFFEQHGERAFRAAEAAVIRRVSATRGQVIAVGGGAVADPANTTSLRSTGDLIWLDADPSTLADRVGEAARDRPLVANSDDLAGRLAEIRSDRDAAYAAAASKTIDTAGIDPADIAEAVLDWALHQPGLLARDERAIKGAKGRSEP